MGGADTSLFCARLTAQAEQQRGGGCSPGSVSVQDRPSNYRVSIIRDIASTKLRVLGYVRVSQTNGREGDRFISPSEQRQAIERFVASRRHELVDVLVDLDESGATFERPMFKEALARLDASEADGLCPARLPLDA